MPQPRPPVPGHGGALPTVLDVEGEPRVSSEALADFLGYADRRDILQVITRKRTELECFGALVRGAAGICPQAEDKIKRGRGRPSLPYLLNEGQAVLTAILSSAPRAAVVRHQVVTVFLAHRAGRAMAPVPLPADPVAEAIATLMPPGGPAWEGSPAELLRVLTRLAPATDRAALGWPRSPRGLGVAVDRLAPALRAGGIAVERRRSACRIIRLSRCAPFARAALPGRIAAPARLRDVVARQAEELGALRGRLAALEIRTGRAA